jgi:hypothetical protein
MRESLSRACWRRAPIIAYGQSRFGSDGRQERRPTRQRTLLIQPSRRQTGFSLLRNETLIRLIEDPNVISLAKD